MAVNQSGPKPFWMKTYAVLALAVLAQASGNVFLSKGMKYIVSFDKIESAGLISVPLQAAGNPMIWIGVALSITFYILFATALSWSDLSLVLPIISAEVVVNVAFAEYFLGEPVSAVRWTGTFLIASGVILVLRSEKKKESSNCDDEAGRVASER
jgi:uncharacterized membrane protein